MISKTIRSNEDACTWKCLFSSNNSGRNKGADATLRTHERYNMRTSLFMIFIIWTGFLVSSCEDGGAGLTPFGAYSYISYDSTGRAIVRGWLTLLYRDSSRVTGEWHFAAIGNPEGIGPQVGDGNLAGGMNQDSLWVGLHPEFVDNNLVLFGKLEGSHYRGQWTWISFRGPTNHGTFEATRN
jgi:hypothetical protein